MSRRTSHRWRTFSSASCIDAITKPSASARTAHEIQPSRRGRPLSLRDGASAANDLAESRGAGHHDLALLRRLRCGDWVQDVGSGWRALWRLHRTRTDHAFALYAEPVQR